jgi:preprotein translocase subunit SecD
VPGQPIRPGDVAAPADYLAAGAYRDGGNRYRLAPAALVGADVGRATAVPGIGAQWTVYVAFTPGTQQRFTALTASLVDQQVAMVLDGTVQSAPTVEEAIPGGAQLTAGNAGYSEARARQRAGIVSAGPLPVALRIATPPMTAPPTAYSR